MFFHTYTLLADISYLAAPRPALRTEGPVAEQARSTRDVFRMAAEEEAEQVRPGRGEKMKVVLATEPPAVMLPQAQERAWPVLAECVGHPEWLEAPRWQTAESR